MKKLIEALRRQQGAKKQMEFAAELGIGQSYLSELLRGEKHLGVEVAHRIMQNCPGLKKAIRHYLLDAQDDDPDGDTQVA